VASGVGRGEIRRCAGADPRGGSTGCSDASSAIMQPRSCYPPPHSAGKGNERWKSVARSLAETWLTFRFAVMAAMPFASISVPWASRAA